MDQPRLSRQMLEVAATMLQAPTRAWYGLELAKAGGIRTGTIYATLASLESASWIESYWEEIDPRKAGRPRRRFYRFTAEGEAAARSALDWHVSRLQQGRISLRPRWQTT